ncbi:AAA+ family ATPase [Roseinatronobacter sp. NSM]|uniref:AAA+ family ATPase n=1 Tax=Roseinatronobacter sp. NSM TaxID=3457785 RepID=UPI0040363746
MIIAVCLCLAFALPAVADNPDTPPDTAQPDSFSSLLDRMLRGFMDNIDPHLRQMDRDMQALEPDLRRLLGQLRDMVDYHAPEILPNGDILIRRRQAAPDGDGNNQPASPDPDADAPPALEL